MLFRTQNDFLKLEWVEWLMILLLHIKRDLLVLPFELDDVKKILTL